MSPAERQDVETRVDRCLRRGEFAEAVGLLRQLCAAFPEDTALQTRLGELEQSLEPGEQPLMPARQPLEPPPQSQLERAESLASSGDYGGAIAAYRRLLQANPDNELVRERLTELFTLAQAAAPRPSAPTASREAVLGELLSRITARRRP